MHVWPSRRLPLLSLPLILAAALLALAMRSVGAARDVALVTTIGSDIDGDLRNIGAGPDIGADETRFVRALYLTLVRR